MGGLVTLELIRALYDYHGWANRRLCDVAAALGEEAEAREVGKQFSFPTIRRMFVHIYGADWGWLMRWKGTSPSKLPGDEITSLAMLRERWDALAQEQRAFLGALTPADLTGTLEYRNIEGKRFRLPLGPLLQHVVNHATHHRSEIATMLTMISGSPPDTGLVAYYYIKTGQA